jgi:hypothetical protein
MGGCLSSGGTCVPSAPADWLGPVARFDADPRQDACPLPAASLLSGGRAVATSQPPCPCAPALPACTQPEVTFYALPACGASKLTPHEHVVMGDDCEVIDPLTARTSLLVTEITTPTPGNTCAITGTLPDALYEEPGELCSLAGTDDCGDEQACVPAGELTCIYRTGEHECPASWDLKLAFVTAQSDCSCSGVAPTLPKCSGVLDFWYGTSCSGPPDIGNVPASMPICQSGQQAAEYRVQYEPSGASSCAQVEADAFVIGSFTLCCMSS